jgi:hypothetical protein
VIADRDSAIFPEPCEEVLNHMAQPHVYMSAQILEIYLRRGHQTTSAVQSLKRVVQACCPTPSEIASRDCPRVSIPIVTITSSVTTSNPDTKANTVCVPPKL